MAALITLASTTIDRVVCEHCLTEMDADELAPDHNGDKTCRDCLSSWAGQLDNAGGFTYAA
jgi:hypothetical protein